MSLQAAVRNRYVRDTVSTVSPAKLVTMLYDKLSRDLDEAEQALEARDVQTAHARLINAQEIILELKSGLDVAKWDGGPGLMGLYEFMYRELIVANVCKDVTKVRSVKDTAEPLREAWHQVAGGAAGSV